MEEQLAAQVYRSSHNTRDIRQLDRAVFQFALEQGFSNLIFVSVYFSLVRFLLNLLILLDKNKINNKIKTYYRGVGQTRTTFWEKA